MREPGSTGEHQAQAMFGDFMLLLKRLQHVGTTR
jgi:hypothetical protein